MEQALLAVGNVRVDGRAEKSDAGRVSIRELELDVVVDEVDGHWLGSDQS